MPVYTVRNAIIDAYDEAGVIGPGQQLTAEQQSDGLRLLNLMLDDIYSTNKSSTTKALTVVFTGKSDYTIGPEPYPLPNPIDATVPDIVVPVSPMSISEIILDADGSRYSAVPITPGEYFGRSSKTGVSTTPDKFWFERSQPLGIIKFKYGSPSGAAEIIYKPALVDVTANTSLDELSRALRPYIRYSLAARIAERNGFEAMSLKAQANVYWSNYVSGLYEGQTYKADGSAPGRRNKKYNIYNDE